METLQERIHATLIERLGIRGIVWRADDRFRELEGLSVREPEIWGEVADRVTLLENRN
ncbi:MAG: hypothetical protein R3C03_19205 [Pirellulaceae bacterium]